MTEIPSRIIGTSGPSVSRICLGTMMFGDACPEEDAFRILDRYGELGGNFLDTADTYCGGESERIVGRFLRRANSRFHLATKVGNPVPEIGDNGGLRPERIVKACALSLDRLGIEKIDYYYLHLDDANTALDEIISCLGDLMAGNKIGAWGFSNFRPWKIAEMIRIADRMGIARPRLAQPYYHLLNRVAETDYLPACRHFGIGVVSYSPLARGVLTGKYDNGVPEGSRGARGDKRILETELMPQTIELARQLSRYAERSHRAPGSLALRWVLANDAITSVLAGPRTLEQFESYVVAFDSAYDARDEAFLSGLCAPGHIPVPDYNDPRYPLDGRRVLELA